LFALLALRPYDACLFTALSRELSPKFLHRICQRHLPAVSGKERPRHAAARVSRQQDASFNRLNQISQTGYLVFFVLDVCKKAMPRVIPMISINT